MFDLVITETMIVSLVLFPVILTDIISRRFETSAYTIEFIWLCLVSMIELATSLRSVKNYPNVMILAITDGLDLLAHIAHVWQSVALG